MSYPVEISRDVYDAMIRSDDSGSYPPGFWDDVYDNDGAGLVEVRKSVDAGVFSVDMLILVWEISGAMLPDNFTPTTAALRFTLESFANDDGRLLMADWHDQIPIQGSGVWSANVSGDALAGYDLAGLAGAVDGDTITIPLDNVSGIGSCLAGLKLMISGDEPAGDNYVRMYDYSNGLGETPAELIIGGTVTVTEESGPPCDPQEPQESPNSYEQRREYEISFPESAAELSKQRAYPHVEYRAKVRRVGRVVRAI